MAEAAKAPATPEGTEVLIPEIMSPEEVSREQFITRRLQSRTKLLPQVVEFLRDPEEGEKQLEKYRDLVTALRKHSIHITYASDWVLHQVKAGDGTTTTGYLQDIGCERAAMIWGISRVSKITGPTREIQEDESYIVRCEADFFCERTGLLLPEVQGARWSGEDFFTRRADKSGGFLNPLWVEASALRNMHGRAVRSLGGLSAVPVGLLEACGLDVHQCQLIVWAGAREGKVEGEEKDRGAGASQALFNLLKARAKEEGKEISALLRELCTLHRIPAKNRVSDLTESQVADLTVIVRELPPAEKKGGA